MRPSRVSLLVLVAVAALVVYALIPGEGARAPLSDEGEGAKEPQKQAAPAQQIEGLVLEGLDEKGGRWRVRAQSANADALGSVGELSDVTFTLDGKDGAVEAIAASCVCEAESSVALSGGVQLEWLEWHAELEDALYDMKSQRITTGAGVTFTGERLTVTGQTLEIDLTLNVATIGGGAKAVFEGVKE